MAELDQEFDIGGRMVGHGHPCFIIAEAGVNHNGDMDMARKLVEVAAEARADAIKFQSFRAEKVVSRSAPKAEYQLKTTDATESQEQMLRKLELSPEAHVELQAHCKEVGLQFISTAFDIESVDLLAELGVPVFKIPSGEVNNLPFLDHVARKGKPVILSTGMSYLDEVEQAMRVMHSAGCQRMVVLHCVSNYPADSADVNLRAMETIAAGLDVPVGYSDHTLGIHVPLAARAMGACVIEKHFTLDRKLPGPDHPASLEPDELAEMVKGIRAVESALGHGRKEPADSELNNRQVVRRSLAAMIDLAPGEVLTANMLTQLRPGTGIAPTFMDQVIGRTLRHPRRSGELLQWSDFE